MIQDKDIVNLLDDVKVVTERKPTEKEMKDLIFAWKAVKHLKSNGVVIAKDKATIGIGGGEVNRFWAVQNAVERAKEKIKEVFWLLMDFSHLRIPLSCWDNQGNCYNTTWWLH